MVGLEIVNAASRAAPRKRRACLPRTEVCAGSPANEPTAACFIGVLGDTDTATLAVSDQGWMLDAPMAVHVHDHEPLSSLFPVLAACADVRGSSLTVVSQQLYAGAG